MPEESYECVTGNLKLSSQPPGHLKLIKRARRTPWQPDWTGCLASWLRIPYSAPISPVVWHFRSQGTLMEWHSYRTWEHSLSPKFARATRHMLERVKHVIQIVSESKFIITIGRLDQHRWNMNLVPDRGQTSGGQRFKIHGPFNRTPWVRGIAINEGERNDL